MIRAHPGLFILFEAGLLELGEQSGGLEEILQLLGTYCQAEHCMMLWVKKTMAYLNGKLGWTDVIQR